MQNLTIFDLELEKSVTGRQVNVVSLVGVPASDDQPPGTGIVLNLLEQVRDLIHTIVFRVIASKRAPEVTVYWSKIAGFAPETKGVSTVSPLCPDIHSLCPQVRFVGVT